jgi:hypothetical protein
MSIESINQTMAADIKTLLLENQSIKNELAELKQIIATRSADPSDFAAAIKASPAKGKKPSAKAEAKKAAAAAAAESGEPTEAKAPSAWNQLVAQTVADMRQNGWESWTDLKGVVWPASRRGPVKDKSGAQSEGFVYDGGDHDGKAASPALGGMVRASYLKAQTDPAALAKAQAYHAKLDEKRSAASASVGEGEKEAPVADAPAPKKAGRKPMTAEQKASAAAKRAEKKASEKAEAEKPVTEVEAEFTEPAEAAPAVTPKKAAFKPKTAPAAPKKLDLRFYAWEHNGKNYITNERFDVVDRDEGCWVGRFNGTIIDESVPEPDDLEGVEMRE